MENDKPKKTILLVDDDVDYLFQTETMLKAAGFNVITAGGQDEAEMILKTTKPDLVLSDLMMENLDAGFSFSYHIKKVDPKIPVIIVTGVANDTGMKLFNGSEEERSWVKADKIMTKPVKYDQLIKEINKFLD
jgi:two-component system, cell cycle sensor histidine kinase and response regulator CckA